MTSFRMFFRTDIYGRSSVRGPFYSTKITMVFTFFFFLSFEGVSKCANETSRRRNRFFFFFKAFNFNPGYYTKIITANYQQASAIRIIYNIINNDKNYYFFF